jgi:hypothetical protein
MATIKQLSGQNELEKIQGIKMTSFFSKSSTKVELTKENDDILRRER